MRSRSHMQAAAAVALLAGMLTVPAAAVSWVELGPAPIVNGDYTGRISAIVCSPTNPNLYYVGGADGGVWRSQDGGLSWKPLTDQLPSSPIGALALSPADEKIIYAGTGEANYANHSRFGQGLYRSTDGGDTWEILAAETFAGRCFSRLMIDPQNPQRMWASITRAGGFPELAAAKGHPGATGPLGVFRSLDGGVTWNRLEALPNLCATDVAINPASPNIVYAAIGRIFGAPENGIYRSTDYGDTWTKLGGGLPTSAVGRITLGVAPTLPSEIFALIAHSADTFGGGAGTLGAYRSDNGGDTWVTLPVGSIQATYGWYLNIVGVAPDNPSIVFMGGLDLRRSVSAGSSWVTVTPPHVDMHAIAWDASKRILVGDDGGVHRTSNGGSSWESLNDGLGVIQCYAGLSTHPTDPGMMVVGLQDNGTVRLLAGAWTQGLGGDGGWTQIDQTSPNYVFGEFQGSGNLYRSTNGGSSYSFSGSGISTGDRNAFEPPYLIDPADPMRMLYATHRMYLSTSKGTSWSAYSGDLTGGAPWAIRALAQAPSDPNVVYAATNDGRILQSIDRGKTFTLRLTGVPGWPRITRELFVHPADPQTVYLAVAYFNEQQIRRSTDGGQTWQALDASFPDVPVNVVAVDVRGNKPVIYAGVDGGLYRSVDDGGAWHRYGQGLPNAAVIDLRLEPQRSRLIAATQGRGVWQIAIGVPGDMNGDGQVNAFDIDPFVLALTDPAAYAAQFPGLDAVVQGDLTGDGVVNAFDIDPFVAVLAG